MTRVPLPTARVRTTTDKFQTPHVDHVAHVTTFSSWCRLQVLTGVRVGRLSNSSITIRQPHPARYNFKSSRNTNLGLFISVSNHRSECDIRATTILRAEAFIIEPLTQNTMRASNILRERFNIKHFETAQRESFVLAAETVNDLPITSIHQGLGANEFGY